ncbi:MAG: hypothetical protein M3Z07_01680 [Candidatus Eremiobacteraeota bacterium]|nr:hypothetical protein [Candidatus Eremiobacteraeota bacterium]
MYSEPTTTDLMTAIVDLHGAVSAGFAAVDKRFGRVETRLDRVETRLTSGEGKTDGLERRFSAFEITVLEKFERMDRRFDDFERRGRRR